MVALLCFETFYAQGQEHSLYRMVEHQSLSSVPWQEEEWPTEQLYEFLTRCMRYQRHPQKARKRRATFQIICPSLEQDGCMQSKVLDDPKTWNDLCLFCGKEDLDCCLINNIAQTRTELGRTRLACLLVQPTDNINELKRRQHIIKELVDNPQLLESLDRALSLFASSENLLISFWMQDLLQHQAKRHYFNVPRFEDLERSLNNNEVALDIKTVLDRTRLGFNTLSTAAACIVLPIYALTRFNAFDATKDLNSAARRLMSTGGAQFGLITSYLRNKFADGIAAILVSSYCGLSVKENFEWTRDNIILDQYVQEKMIAVANAYRAIKNMTEALAVAENEMLHLPCAKAIYDFIYILPHESDDLKKLFELLATPTFKGQVSFFSRTGRVLTAYALMHKEKQYWVNVLAAIAEIDAYVSIAKLYKEYHNQEHGYCFAQFIESDKPSISITDFWNPLIKSSCNVANSINIGGSYRSNVILTGPNAGGKSTILRALAINIILAQSFGIAPAKEITITPFSSIATYLDITDDITAGNSLFKAEVLRAHYLIEKVSSLAKNQFSFIVIDEMFNGTSPREGEAASFSIAKHLGTFENSICIVATHFPLMTTLHDLTTTFDNYKVSVAINDHGVITYPFKLEHGISDQNIAIDMLAAQGFTSDILEDARSIIKVTTTNKS